MNDVFIVAPGKRRSVCPHCPYVTDRKNNLKRHIITMHHDSSKILECCGQVFKSKAALREHVTSNHKSGYKCHICSRNFCRKALLRRHLTVHSGQKDFRCPSCPYATSHKSNLERHQKVHVKVYENDRNKEEIYPRSLKFSHFPEPRFSTEDVTLNRYCSYKLPHKLSLVGKAHSRIMSRYQSIFRQKKSVLGKIKQDLSASSEEKLVFAKRFETPAKHAITLSENNQRNLKRDSVQHRQQFISFPIDTSQPNKENTEKSRLSKENSKMCFTSTTEVHESVDRHKLDQKTRTTCKRIWQWPYKCTKCDLSFDNQIDQFSHTCKANPIRDLNIPVTCLIMKGVDLSV